MALVDITHGKQRHVHYRDSKLTFLLRVSACVFACVCVCGGGGGGEGGGLLHVHVIWNRVRISLNVIESP